MFTANCLLCGSENSENVCGSYASLLDTERFDFASRAEQTSKSFVCLLVYILLLIAVWCTAFLVCLLT